MSRNSGDGALQVLWLDKKLLPETWVVGRNVLKNFSNQSDSAILWDRSWWTCAALGFELMPA